MSIRENYTRREFMCVVAGCAAAASCTDLTHSSFFRDHLDELSPEQIADVVKNLEAGYAERFGVEIKVGTEAAQEDVQFAYALDVARCVGCRRCVYACVDENNQSRDPEVHWIRVLEMDKDRGVDFAHADAYYDAETVPRDGHFYLPVACQHCEDPPCVKSCPVQATWKEPDGIVVIDYDWCIGCRCCVSSCPYGARHFNWSEPNVPPEEINPDTHLLGNRPRSKGEVEKCTFCIHRVRKGLYPSCVEACPAGARKFGNLLDPDSEIREVLRTKRVFVLKTELKTHPRFFYFFGP